MTLTVALSTPDGVWMGSDRIQGSFNYFEIATPKVYRVDGQGISFLAGFAGSPRVVQAVLRLEPPPLDDGQALESWMTCWCDTVYSRASELGLMRDPGNGDEPYLAGDTNQLIATHGRVFVIAENLQWTEPAAGWAATGGAAETWAGAFEAYRKRGRAERWARDEDASAGSPDVEAARLAWTIAQRHHRIGPLADELTLPEDDD